MRFTKYHKFGAYHWKQYDDKNTKYSRHVDRVKEWIKEKNVLDIGAGDGRITHLLGIKGVDNEPEGVRLAQEKGADVVLGDAYHLFFKDEEFEAAFMGDVLEHFEFPRKALKEARRVIKKYLYVAVPDNRTRKDRFHCQEWTPEELKELVESEGFILEGEMEVVPKDKRIYAKFKKMTKLDTLDYIIEKYNINPNGELPIEIPNVGKNDLAKLLHELDFKVGIEVGVAEGNYSKKLCEANPQMKICGIDPWKVYDNYADYSGQDIGLLYEQAKKQLAPFPNYKIIKEFSMDAVKKFEDNSLDFVYIDANHENPYVTEDIVEWSKKIRPGGIVSGHDYFRGRAKNGNLFNVIEAVQKYTKDNNIKPWFVLGLSVKIPGLIRDASRSWFWVKL